MASSLKGDQELLANEVKAFLAESKSLKIAFGVKILENSDQRLQHLPFPGLEDVAIPVPLKDIEKIKSMSIKSENGSVSMNLKHPDLKGRAASESAYYQKTIPQLIGLAMKNISEEVVNTKISLVCRARQLIISETGAQLSVPPTSFASRSFATVIASFPVENGHTGGQLQIQHPSGSAVKTFDCSAESSLHFYYTFYRSSCIAQSAAIASGTRLSIIFDLLYPPDRPCLPDLVLRCLSAPDTRLIAFPLFQRYSEKTRLSFDSLQGDDQRLADQLRSMGSIQLHLAVLEIHRRGKSNRHANACCECCQKRKCPCQVVKMVSVKQETVRTSTWADLSGPCPPFTELHIDPKKELVGDLSIDAHSDDKVMAFDPNGMLKQRFNRVVLVAWTKESSVRLDWLHRPTHLLGTMESSHLELTDRSAITERLKTVIDAYYNLPAHKRSSKYCCQLFNLCLKLKAGAEALAIANKEDQFPFNNEALFQLVQLLGWPACSALVKKMIVRADQLVLYISLACSLLELGLTDAFVEVAHSILTLLASPGVLLTVSPAYLTRYATAVKDYPNLFNGLVAQIKTQMSFQALYQFLNLLQTVEKVPPKKLIEELSLHLASLVVPQTISVGELLSVVDFLVASEVDLDVFLDQNQTRLMCLMSCESIWKLSDQGERGKKVLAAVVDAKIQQLVNQLGAVDQPGRAEEDDVCWEFKDAYVPNHPLVTAFLRSKQRVFVYANFNGKQHARNWARKHCYEIHGSLELGGQGHKAFCRIEKIPNRRLREEAIKKRKAELQKELLELIDRRIKQLGDATCTIVMDSNTPVIRHLNVRTDLIGSPGQQNDVQAERSSTVKQIGDEEVEVIHLNISKTPITTSAAKPVQQTPTTPVLAPRNVPNLPRVLITPKQGVALTLTTKQVLSDSANKKSQVRFPVKRALMSLSGSQTPPSKIAKLDSPGVKQ